LLIVSSPSIVIVFEELLSKEPSVPITSSEPLTIVSVPVVSVNGIFSVTVTFPSMVILSKPPGSIPPLQFAVLDQSPVAPPAHTVEPQTSTDWFPSIRPLITPEQLLFIVPVVLSRLPPALMVMVPKLEMVPELRMPLLAPPFDIVMVPELVMVPAVLSLMMPVPPEF